MNGQTVYKVKVSHPKSWERHGHWPYKHHFPNDSQQWGNFKFFINDVIDECDFWIIHETLDKPETVSCNRQNIVLVTGEEKQSVPFYAENYLRQFGTIITTRDDIAHSRTIRTFYLCPWGVRKTYDQIQEADPVKTSELSAIISNNVSTEGHIKRYAFVNKLKGHFKDHMVWYGKGENSLADKWTGLEKFRYSLAIENTSAPFYFTEKIMDCFCASVMPIYWGCPNISDFFDKDSMILIDLNDFQKSIKIIENAVEERRFEKYHHAILDSKKKVLEHYQFVAGISNLLQGFDGNLKKEKINIKPKTIDNHLLSAVKKSIGKLLNLPRE